jgi:hypothetical protein
VKRVNIYCLTNEVYALWNYPFKYSGIWLFIVVQHDRTSNKIRGTVFTEKWFDIVKKIRESPDFIKPGSGK